jgi:hypothetical protein
MPLGGGGQDRGRRRRGRFLEVRRLWPGRWPLVARGIAACATPCAGERRLAEVPGATSPRATSAALALFTNSAVGFGGLRLAVYGSDAAVLG